MRQLIILLASVLANLAAPPAARADDVDPPAPGTATPPAPAPPSAGPRSHLRGLHLYATGTVELGNGVGGRLQVHGFVPRTPAYVAAVATYMYGVEPAHLAGERDHVLARFFGEATNLELRAGLSLATTGAQTVDGYHDRTLAQTETVTVYRRTDYRLAPPTHRRRTLYVGYRWRTTPGAACPGDVTAAQLPADCAELADRFLLLGASTLFAIDADVAGLRVRRSRIIDLHLMLAPANASTRTSFARRLGAEVQLTYGGFGGGAVTIGAGWDGANALLNVGLGLGVLRGFGG